MGLAKAIRISSGEYYSVASACEGAVSASKSRKASSDIKTRMETGGGSAIDWFYHELHVKYAYQIKLRDTGSYGFLLPSDQIVPTGEEIFNALKYFGDFLLGNKGVEMGLDDELHQLTKEVEREGIIEVPVEIEDFEEDQEVEEDEAFELRRKR
jgi:extracellular matrix protein 14